eukprot:CAMPEP_0194533160 /NCGR_PEP_ID=MMETSP0253-20130528/70967_1 /TAXON_ID=2966 /ORGANISM="Noctiluca scintillans" /LENGTH=36 /DNA_ID= /DNA_START= /DNA_END= /DNA_ORIENTATION=
MCCLDSVCNCDANGVTTTQSDAPPQAQVQTNRTTVI